MSLDLSKNCERELLIMSIIKEGWIEKKGQTFMAGYRKRWLVLYSDQTLKYFEDTYYEILKGSIDISEASKVQQSNESSKNWKFGWEIVTPNRSWYFSSKSEYARKQWIQHLQNVRNTSSSTRTSYNHKSRSLQTIAKQHHHGGSLRDESPHPLIAVHSDSTDHQSLGLQLSPNRSDDHFGDSRSRTTSLENRLEKAKVNSSVNAKSDGNSKSNKGLESEYTPGMYSHFGSTVSTNNSNHGVTGNERKETSQGTKVSPQSQFGKEYKYLSHRTMTEIINKGISLSVHKQKQNELKKVTMNDRFKWKQYQTMIDDLIHEDENMADDLNHRLDDLKCFCGGNLRKKKCEEKKFTITCQFCGPQEIKASTDGNDEGYEYFECDATQSPYHDGGWTICCRCCYLHLIHKYYSPSTDAAPRRVGVSIKVDRISCINAEDQTFRTRLLIEHQWKPTKQEVASFRDKPADFESFWSPHFEFPDCIQVHESSMKPTYWNTEYLIVRRGESNGEWISPFPFLIVGEYWIDATFGGRIDLKHFPVDSQNLSIRIQCQQYSSICDLTAPLHGASMVNVRPFYAAIPEFKIHCPKMEFISKRIGPVIEHSMINLSIKLERDQPVFLRMAMIWMLLSVMTLIAFSIDLEENGSERMQYLATLLMATLTFQFVSNGNTPNVGYLTLMDWYSLQTYLFLFAMLTESAIGIRYELWEWDRVCFWVFRAVMMVIQGAFGIWTWRVRKNEKRKLTLTSSEMEHNVSNDKEWIALDKFDVNGALSL